MLGAMSDRLSEEARPGSERPAGAGTPVPPREWAMLAGILLLALALRTAHLREIVRNDPFFYLPAVDPRIYHDWAVAIARGQWIGDEIFSLGPLYPYLLGLLYWVAGPNILLAKTLQVLLGMGVCALVWWLGRQLFSPRVGLLAAAGWAVYAMAIFYEGTLMITNVQTPLVLGLLLACEAGRRRPTPRAWGLAGALLGLCALSRPNVLLFGAAVVPWLLWARPAAGRRVLLSLAFLAGLLVVVLPVTARNYAVGGELVWIVAGGGAQFYTGNNPEADGTYHIPSRFPKFEADTPEKERTTYRRAAEEMSGGPVALSEVSPFWARQGLAWIRAHPLDWLALEWRKLSLFFNAAEIWNNRTITLAREFSWVLRLPLLSFGLVMPLAFVGLVASARRFRRLVFPYAAIGVFLVSALLFFVISRFRMPAVPVLLIFASVGVFALIDALRERAIGRGAALAAVGIAGALFVHRGLVREDLSMAYYNLANRFLQRGAHEQAIAHYWRSLRGDPGYFPAYENLARAYEASGRHPEETRSAWRGVLQLALARGDEARAARARERLARLESGAGDAGGGERDATADGGRERE